MKLCLELEKLIKKIEKNRGKAWKKVNAWAGISKGEKQVFNFLLRIWLKNYILE